MKIKEIFINLSYENNQKLHRDITNLVLKYESKLTLPMISHDINVRNQQGEGLMTPSVLSMHVQDELVDKDLVFYVTLDKNFDYFSRSLNQKFQVNKLVIIIVNPKHKLDRLSKMEAFIA